MITAPGSARWVAQQPGYLAPDPIVVIVVPADALVFDDEGVLFEYLDRAIDPAPLRSPERDRDALDQLEAIGIWFG